MNRKFFFLCLLISITGEAAAKAQHTNTAGEIAMMILGVFVCIIASLASAGMKATPEQKNATASIFKNDELYEIHFYRQSGNHHRSVTVYGNAVMKNIEGAFNRAKIYGDYAITETPLRIDFQRTIHNHRGSSEGKRLGGCFVYKADGSNFECTKVVAPRTVTESIVSGRELTVEEIADDKRGLKIIAGIFAGVVSTAGMSAGLIAYFL